MSDQKEKIIGPGHTLFKQGEKGGDLIFVKRGKIDLFIKDEETGEQRKIGTFGERSVLGSMSFLEGDPRSATAKAATEVAYYAVGSIQREKLLKQVPVWFQVLLKDLAANLRKTNDRFLHAEAERVRLEKKVVALERRLQRKAAENEEDSDKPTTPDEPAIENED